MKPDPYLGLLPSESLQGPVVLQDGKLDGLPGRVETDSELRLVLRVGDADEVPAVAGVAGVAEGCHEGELLREALVEGSAKRQRGTVSVL